MDDDQSIYSVACTDEVNALAMLCIPGFKALEDGATYVVYRGLSTSATSPGAVMRTFSMEQEDVPMKEVNDVVPYEESLTYQPESLHKVIGTAKDFTVTANGDRNAGIKLDMK